MSADSKSKINFYGAIASIIGLVAAIAVFWFGWFEAKKALSIQLLSKDTWFIGPLEPDFKLTYKGELAENVASFLIQVQNTGRQPIVTSDFEKPIDLTLKGTSKIISVRQVGAEPSDLILRTSYEGNKIHIEPALLNSSDKVLIAITALCSSKPDIDVNLTYARIAGIKRVIFEPGPKKKDERSLPLVSIVALIIGIVASFLSNLILSGVQKRLGRVPMEYMKVLFPKSRRVLLNGEPRGYTNELLELQGGKYKVSLEPPPDFTPPEQEIDLRNTSAMEPLEVKFEEA
ncbi:MAG: hypothetical protein ACYDIC_18525 [Desulfobaccales bacterium]